MYLCSSIMNKKRFRNFSIMNARVTSTVSVALVLLMLGIVGRVAIGADSLTREIKETLGFNIILAEEQPQELARQMADEIRKEPYARSVTLFTADDAMVKWEQETGENIIEVLGVNPFSSEIEVKVVSDYANTDSLAILYEKYAALDPVEEVTLHAEMISKINRNLKPLLLILSSISIALLIISLVLINNTVRLTVFARRFTIHTMRLVGATDGCIRRPFVLASMLNGIVAAVIASAVLALLYTYGLEIEPTLSSIITWGQLGLLSIALILLGTGICAAAATFSTNRYLRLSYDDMFE